MADNICGWPVGLKFDDFTISIRRYATTAARACENAWVVGDTRAGLYQQSVQYFTKIDV